uniref:Polyisoprenoid-binding protein n=1 Tax=Desulfacinum infernum TaxID=35837 RepID=A0A831ZXF0_9BACT
MRKMTMFVAIAWILTVGAGMGWPQDTPWTFDPAHTSVTFTIQHILAKVVGTFDDIQGKVVFDPAHPEKGSLEVSIPVGSINTRVAQRDDHLRSPDFFDAAKYPVMTFVSREIRPGQEPGRFIARGVLTIKNVSRPLDLPFAFLGIRPDPFDPKREIAGFEAHVSLDRLEFGVGNGEFFRKGLIGKDVDVSIYVEMEREKSPSN